MTLKLETRNFRLLNRTNWSPSGVSVLVGPNGSGKTTLLLALEFLRNAYLRSPSAAASHDSFGGAWGVRTWGSPEEEPVTMAVSIGDLRWEVQLVTKGANIVDQLGENITQGANEIVTRLPLSDRAYYRGAERECGDRLAFRAVVDGVQDHGLDPLVKFVSGIRIHRSYNIHGLQMNGSRQGGDLHVSPSGENVFTVLRNWRDRRELRQQFQFVMEGLRAAFPELTGELDFHFAGLTVTADFSEAKYGEACPAALAPHGWLAGLLHLAVVAGARPGSFVGIDEFGNSLHPFAIRQLTEAIRDWTEGQNLTVCLATHSPVLLDEFKEQPELVFVMEGEERPTPLNELYDEDWLAQFSFGKLYAHGDFGAKHPQSNGAKK